MRFKPSVTGMALHFADSIIRVAFRGERFTLMRRNSSAYVGGVVAGLGFFTGTRGLFFPWEWNLWFRLGCVISFGVALGYERVRRGAPRLSGHSAA